MHSLYLDSDDLSLHHAGVNGTRNRFKLRLTEAELSPIALRAPMDGIVSVIYRDR